MNNEEIRSRIAAIIELYADASWDDAMVAAAEVIDDFDVRARA